MSSDEAGAPSPGGQAPGRARSQPRVAVITGAGSGMGRACAVRLARSGYSIAALDISEPGLRTTRQQVEAGGGTCLPVYVDVADESQVDAAMTRVGAELGRPYVLALAAGISPRSRTAVADLSSEELQRVFAVNVFGVMYCLKSALRLMTGDSEGGRIVLWASTGARISAPGSAAYCASKAAVESIGRTLANELARSGITVNVILPGAIDTPMIAGDDLQFFSEVLPAGYVAGPEEVASLVEFLCGPDAGYLTGSGILMDGGFATMHLLHHLSEARAAAARGQANAESEPGSAYPGSTR